MAFAFLSFEVAGGDQAAEPAIGVAIGRIGQRFEAIVGHEARADQKFDFFAFSLRHRRAPRRQKCCGRRCRWRSRPSSSARRHHFLRMRGAAKEGEIGRYSELGIRGHWYMHHANDLTQTAHARTSAARGFAAVKAFAIEPEAAAVAVLDEIIIARRRCLRPLADAVAPPFARRSVPALARRRCRESRRASGNAAAGLRGRAR